MALERDIHQLLYAHDCVIVPGFGGFLAHYRPARLDEQRQVVHPPAKDISFNRHLTRTDGLLAQEIAERERLDHAKAEGRVEELVEQWRSRLQASGRLELDRIGTFFHDAERNLQFTPDKRTNFLREAYGLRPVVAVPVPMVRPGPVLVAATNEVPVQEEVAVEQETLAARTSWWPAAAAAAAVIGTLGTWWWVGQDRHTSDMAFLHPSGPALYRPAAEASFLSGQLFVGTSEDTSPWVAPTEGTGVHRLPIAGSEGPLVAVDLGRANDLGSQVPPAAPVTTAVATRAVDLKFHIIGGCFRDKENADRFASELQAKGFAAHVLDRVNGLYRVAYGSYAKRAMAQEALQAVRKEEAPQAWMLVR